MGGQVGPARRAARCRGARSGPAAARDVERRQSASGEAGHGAPLASSLRRPQARRGRPRATAATGLDVPTRSDLELHPPSSPCPTRSPHRGQRARRWCRPGPPPPRAPPDGPPPRAGRPGTVARPGGGRRPPPSRGRRRPAGRRGRPGGPPPSSEGGGRVGATVAGPVDWSSRAGTRTWREDGQGPLRRPRRRRWRRPGPRTRPSRRRPSSLPSVVRGPGPPAGPAASGRRPVGAPGRPHRTRNGSSTVHSSTESKVTPRARPMPCPAFGQPTGWRR